MVLPVRLLWELAAATGRALDRHLLTPAGRFPFRWLLLPLAWAARTLAWGPLYRAARALVWLPLGLLGRGLAWAVVHLVWVAVHAVARALAAVMAAVGRALLASARAAGRVLADAVVGAWRLAGRLLSFITGWWCARWAWPSAGSAPLNPARRRAAGSDQQIEQDGQDDRGED